MFIGCQLKLFCRKEPIIPKENIQVLTYVER
jgi:hypothetical protein